jgi:hypothetical protein
MRFALALVALAACTDEPAPSGPDFTSHVTSAELPPRVPQPLDILFVVGDTGQQDLSALPGVVDNTIAKLFDGFPDVRIATTSSAVTLELETDVYLDHTQSFAGSLSDALASRLAPGGSDVLARMTSAATFARSNAYLAVVTLTGVDDTSTDADYAAMLKATKSDPANVVVSGIYERPASRLDAFHAAFPNRNTFTSLASGDFAHAFELLAQLERMTLDLPCFAVPLDLDPATTGDQIDCNFSAWREDGTELEVIPNCHGEDPASGSCWEIVADPLCPEQDTGPLRLRGVWRVYRPRLRWQCVTK